MAVKLTGREPVETWFEVKWLWPDQINAVDVLSEAPLSVLIREKTVSGDFRAHRRNKAGQYESFYPTWEQARQALLDHTMQRLHQAHRSVDELVKQFDLLQAMQPPKKGTP